MMDVIRSDQTQLTNSSKKSIVAWVFPPDQHTVLLVVDWAGATRDKGCSTAGNGIIT